MKKFILPLLLLIVLVLAIFIYRNYFSAENEAYRRDVNSEKSATVTAAEIVKQFKTGDTAVNQKYLNKTVSVTGEAGNVEVNPDGNVTVTLKTGDSTFNVFCTLQPSSPKPKTGTTITVKGICTGLVLNDVVLNEAVIVK